MKLREGQQIIVLQHEPAWRLPVQLYTVTKRRGKICVNHWFAEFESFDQAVTFIRKAHQHQIIIDRQSKFGFNNYPNNYS